MTWKDLNSRTYNNKHEGKSKVMIEMRQGIDNGVLSYDAGSLH
jgi:hypothetical protein